MSLVDELARQVRAASGELPVPEVRAAGHRLRLASERLGYVLLTASAPRAVPTLQAASDHLDHAAGALLRAQDALAEYLTVIGLPPGRPRAEDQNPGGYGRSAPSTAQPHDPDSPRRATRQAPGTARPARGGRASSDGGPTGDGKPTGRSTVRKPASTGRSNAGKPTRARPAGGGSVGGASPAGTSTGDAS